MPEYLIKYSFKHKGVLLVVAKNKRLAAKIAQHLVNPYQKYKGLMLDLQELKPKGTHDRNNGKRRRCSRP